MDEKKPRAEFYITDSYDGLTFSSANVFYSPLGRKIDETRFCALFEEIGKADMILYKIKTKEARR